MVPREPTPKETAWADEWAEFLYDKPPERVREFLRRVAVIQLRNDPELGTYSLAEIAEAYNVSTRTLERAIKAGGLKAAKLGKEYRVTRASLAAWIESRS